MSVCPKCYKRLCKATTEAGLVMVCSQCGGRAMGLSVLRKALPKPYASALWMGTKKRMADRGQRCPICRKTMNEVPLPVDGQTVALDICVGCQFVWFDGSEYERFPKQPPKIEEDPREQIPEKAREAMAMAELQLEKRRQRAKRAADGCLGHNVFDENAPDDDWKHLPAILGLPVEYETNPISRIPWATWGLALLLAAVYALTFANLQQVVEQFGLIPAQAFRHGGITLVTNFFLHAGLMHLIGNAYFLLIFGDNVEDHLGPWRFLLLVAAAALVGDLLHIAVDPRSAIPCVGASGGISGLIVFYALRYPHARLGFMFQYYLMFRWVHVPAWTALVAWFVLQLILANDQLAGRGSVSAMAHLGGAAVGAFVWWLWREKATSPKT
jgi:membrane associated rhomboid family serine protease/Zn-finger nucleic acid-binding protein